MRHFGKKTLVQRRKIEGISQENTVYKNKTLEIVTSHSSGAIYYVQAKIDGPNVWIFYL